MLQWNNTNYSPPTSNYDLGSDQWGRVVFYSYFRPPELPGAIEPSTGAAPNAVQFSQWTSGANYPTTIVSNTTGNNLYNNTNPLHGFEAQRFPQPELPGPECPPRAQPTTGRRRTNRPPGGDAAAPGDAIPDPAHYAADL